jgi:hypothetical protein
MKRIFLTILFLLIACNGWAATYYVKTGGDDTAAGTSDGTAWAHCPGMAAWSGTATLTTGDIVYFREGDVWEGADSDGTVAVLETTAGVTYYGLGYGTAGTRAELKSVSTSTVQSHVGVLNIRQSNVTVKHFNVNGNEKYVTGINIGMYATANVDSVVVEDCIVHDVGNSAFDNTLLVYQYGIIVGQTNHQTTSNVQLIDCEVYNVAHEGISLYPSKHLENIVDTVLVRGCKVHDTAHWGATNWGKGIGISCYVKDATVEFNHVYSIPVSGGIALSTMGDVGYPDGTEIRYNIVNGSYISMNGDAAGWGTNHIYGNIVYNGTIYIGGEINDAPQYIYNNTVYNTQDNGRAFWIYYQSTGTSNIEVKNNIFATSGAATASYCYEDNSALISKHSNNLCYRSTSGNWVRWNGAYYKEDAIRTWEATAQYTNPTFAGGDLPTGFSGTYGSNMVPNKPYFSLQAGSPALGNGAVLSSDYNKAINNAGTDSTYTRGTAWDIGAYEYTLDGGATIVNTGAVFSGCTF